MNKTRLLCAAFAATAAVSAGATELTLAAANIDRVRVFNASYQLYHAGDFDIVLANGTTAPPWPAAMRCRDQLVITTPKVNDPKRLMLEKAKTVQFWGSGVASITITDDPAKQAYPNRCSLVGIKF